MTNYDTLKEYEEHNCPVPSYEEWEQLKEYERTVTSYNMKPIDYEMACETVYKLLDEKKGLRQENTKLKELLKECREKLNSCCPVLYSHLINQIDEAIE